MSPILSFTKFTWFAKIPYLLLRNYHGQEKNILGEIHRRLWWDLAEISAIVKIIEKLSFLSSESSDHAVYQA